MSQCLNQLLQNVNNYNTQYNQYLSDIKSYNDILTNAYTERLKQNNLNLNDDPKYSQSIAFNGELYDCTQNTFTGCCENAPQFEQICKIQGKYSTCHKCDTKPLVNSNNILNTSLFSNKFNSLKTNIQIPQEPLLNLSKNLNCSSCDYIIKNIKSKYQIKQGILDYKECLNLPVTITSSIDINMPIKHVNNKYYPVFGGFILYLVLIMFVIFAFK